MNDNPYDELPYEGTCIPTTSPERIATLARFAGYSPPDLQRARVLEIGCGDGGNIIPLGFYHPEWTLVGIDPSVRAIQTANEARQSLGLENVDFFQRDVRDFDTTEKFDIILCHGVFSWVAKDVQDAILEVAASTLAPNGLFYLSYNTEPGWRMRGLVRDRLRRGCAGASREADSGAAKAQLESLSALLGDGEGHPYIDLLRRELHFAAERPTFHFSHEYLAEHNRAFWFGEVHDAAEAHALQYVGDAQRYRLEGVVTAEQRQLAETHFASLKDREESIDFVCYRQLRASVFSSSARKKDGIHPNRVLSQSVLLSALRPNESRFDLSPGQSLPFVCPFTQREIAVDTALGKAALLLLASVYPRGLRFDDVVHQARALLKKHEMTVGIGAAEIDELLDGFGRLHELALVEVRLEHPLPHSGAGHDLPVVHALARYEARQRLHLTSSLHNLIPVDEIDRLLIAHLDGEHDREALLAKLREAGIDQAPDRLRHVVSMVIQWGLVTA